MYESNDLHNNEIAITKQLLKIKYEILHFL